MSVVAGYNTMAMGATFGKIVDGVTSIATSATAVQITTTPTVIGGVWLAVDLQGSGGSIVVGTSTVVAREGSQRGIVLLPGNPSVFLPVNDLSLVWAASQQGGSKLCYAYLQPTTYVSP